MRAAALLDVCRDCPAVIGVRDDVVILQKSSSTIVLLRP
jgi:hypothetical protein